MPKDHRPLEIREKSNISSVDPKCKTNFNIIQTIALGPTNTSLGQTTDCAEGVQPLKKTCANKNKQLPKLAKLHHGEGRPTQWK